MVDATLFYIVTGVLLIMIAYQYLAYSSLKKFMLEQFDKIAGFMDDQVKFNLYTRQSLENNAILTGKITKHIDLRMDQSNREIEEKIRGILLKAPDERLDRVEASLKELQDAVDTYNETLLDRAMN